MLNLNRYKKYKRIPFFLNVLSLLFAGILSAQESIPGKIIKSDETWSGTVIVEGDVLVSAEARLVIEPGSRILFKPNHDARRSGTDKTRAELIIKGMLVARGTIDNKITFSIDDESPRMGSWYGIIISNPSKKSILDFVIVEYAHNGVSVKKSAPQISNSQFRFNYNAGILVEVKAEPAISKNVISENGYAGLICNLGAKPVLSENLITLNQIGIINFRLSQPNLGSLIRNQDYNIGQNRIFENTEYNLYNHSNLSIKAENNSWGFFNAREVQNTIFDKNNDPQYGDVDFEPFNRVRSNLDEFAVIMQEFQPTQPQPSPVSSRTSETRRTVTDSSSEDQGTAVPDQASGDTTLPIGPLAVSQDNKPKITPEEVQPEAISEMQEQSASENQRVLNTANPEQSNKKDEQLKLPPERKQKKESPRIDYEQVFLDPFLDNKMQIIEKKKPQVGDANLGLGSKGIVQIRVIVGKNGLVESAQVLRGLNPYYDRIAREAAEEFKFKPGTVNGRVVRYSTNLFFEF